MSPVKWKTSRDPLFRGDATAGVNPPLPTADQSIVRHILYLDGPGRDTPYISTTEDREIARRFAGRHGRVYQTMVQDWRQDGVKHLPRSELVRLLKGKGKGRAAWPSAYEVSQARAYVEEHAEHLADFHELAPSAPPVLAALVGKLFR